MENDRTMLQNDRTMLTENAGDYGLPDQVACPFCNDASRTELHSPFGPQLSVATYWCRACHAPFDYLKWRPRS